MTANCIEFECADSETAKCSGLISTLSFDIDISVEPLENDGPWRPHIASLGARRAAVSSSMAVSGRSRDSRPVPTASSSRSTTTASTLCIGKAAHQDDASLQAVIPWAPRETSFASGGWLGSPIATVRSSVNSC